MSHIFRAGHRECLEPAPVACFQPRFYSETLHYSGTGTEGEGSSGGRSVMVALPERSIFIGYRNGEGVSFCNAKSAGPDKH